MHSLSSVHIQYILTIYFFVAYSRTNVQSEEFKVYLSFWVVELFYFICFVFLQFFFNFINDLNICVLTENSMTVWKITFRNSYVALYILFKKQEENCEAASVVRHMAVIFGLWFINNKTYTIKSGENLFTWAH